MSTFIAIQLIVLLLLVICSGFFSSSETAYFSLNPIQIKRLETDHPAAALRIRQTMAAPTRLLSTILIGNSVVNIAAASLGYELAEHFAPSRGEVIAVPAVTLLLLVFGEIGPKRLAMLWPERLAAAYARILPAVFWFLAPARLLLERTTRGLEPFFERRSHALTQDEFESVIHLSREEGIIDIEESVMVRAILELTERNAADVMTPRTEIAGIDLEEFPHPGVEEARAGGHRHLPLYRGEKDRIEGILDAWAYSLDPAHDVAGAVNPPYFVPESIPLDRLLGEMQHMGVEVAVIVDEFGGVAGLVTRNDILGEITGHIDDLIEGCEGLVVPLGDRRWLVDAEINLPDLERLLGLRLQAEGVDRLSGWITAEAGHIPSPGETFEAQDCVIAVREVQQHRVRSAVVEKQKGDE